MEKKYTISNISEKQLKLISKSLELYTRLGLLQLERTIIDDVIWSDHFSYGKHVQEIDIKLKEIRKLLVDIPGFENYGTYSTWSLGIGNDKAPKSTSITYEMYSDINDTLYTDRERRGRLKLSDEEDIKIEESNERLEKIMKILNGIKK